MNRHKQLTLMVDWLHLIYPFQNVCDLQKAILFHKWFNLITCLLKSYISSNVQSCFPVDISGLFFLIVNWFIHKKVESLFAIAYPFVNWNNNTILCISVFPQSWFVCNSSCIYSGVLFPLFIGCYCKDNLSSTSERTWKFLVGVAHFCLFFWNPSHCAIYR